MKTYYQLQIVHPEPQTVERLMGIPSSLEDSDWTYCLEVGEEDPPVPFIQTFLDLLHDKFERLEAMGVQRSDISIWLLYEYDDQCNLEFSPSQLAALGSAGIALCVSCWQA